MKLFDFFKKKPTEPEERAMDSREVNAYLLNALQKKLEEFGYDVEPSSQYAALTVASELEIASVVMEGDFHPSILNTLILTIHPKHFPKGIDGYTVGFGETVEEKVASVLKNYFSGIFPVVMESFADRPQSELDFFSEQDGRPILWHTTVGDLICIGNWQDVSEDNYPIYTLLKDKLTGQMSRQKFNWLKLYVAHQPNGDIIAECLLNNQIWDEGTKILYEYVETWQPSADFLAQRQFIMCRRCDAYDD
jgi:Family of unknown function (DUF6348)